MNEVLSCHAEYVMLPGIVVILSVFYLVGGKRIFNKVRDLINFRRDSIAIKKPMAISLHWEVAELRRNTQKISKEWEEMVTIIRSLKDQQHSFKDHIQNEISYTNQIVQEGFAKSSDGFSKINQKFESTLRCLWDDLNTLKKAVQSHDEVLKNAIDQDKCLKENMRHACAQTEHEILIRRRSREHRILEDKVGDFDASRNTPGIQKLLIEFQKEARKNSFKMREEVMSHVEIILNQMCQDQEVIKAAIQQAFASTSFQNQNNLEQFRSAGQEALHYVIEKTEKSNNMMKDKFQEFDKKLKMVFEGMHTTSFDVSAIKNTLDNIDSQLDDIFQRIELGSQKNVEHCEEILGGLQTSSEVWNDNSTRLKEMANILSDIRFSVDELMSEFNDKTEISKEILGPYSELIKNKVAVADYKSSSSEMETVDVERDLNLQKFIQLQRVVRICTEKVCSLNERLENGTSEIKTGIENLMRQIRFICDLVEGLGDRFKLFEADSLQVASTSVEVTKDRQLFGDVFENIDGNKDKLKPTSDASKKSKTNGDSIKKTSRKSKPTVKFRPVITSPVKKGKTIFSNTSSSNNYSKTPERYRRK